jgi:hypothetical protein
MLSSLPLKPGRYVLKVAATDSGGGQMRGVVQYDVTVPDLWKAPLTMSGIALGAAAASRTPTNGSGERWQKALGMPPTTTRDFASTDGLRVYIEVYDRGINSPTTITTTVRPTGEAPIFTRTETLPRVTTPTTQPVITAIPLTGMPPGDYVLSVEPHNGAAREQPPARRLPFRIR